MYGYLAPPGELASLHACQYDHTKIHSNFLHGLFLAVHQLNRSVFVRERPEVIILVSKLCLSAPRIVIGWSPTTNQVKLTVIYSGHDSTRRAVISCQIVHFELRQGRYVLPWSISRAVLNFDETTSSLSFPLSHLPSH